MAIGRAAIGGSFARSASISSGVTPSLLNPDNAVDRCPVRPSSPLLMSRRRPFDLDVEFEEAIEQRGLPV